MDRRIERKRWRRWAPAAGGVALLLSAAIAYLLISPAGARAVEASDVQITAVRSAPFQDFVPARGVVTPLQSIYLDAVEGGRVERLLVADGAVVPAGTVLAALSNPELEREVGASEAEISARMGDARGQMLQLQRSRVDRDRELAQARYERLQAEQALDIRQTLHDKGFVSDAEIRTLTATLEHHRARVAALEASAGPEAELIAGQNREIRQSMAQLQDNLASIRGSLGALQIRAPTAGRLTAFDLQLGQRVEAGQRVGQIDSDGGYKLSAQIDEFYLGRVSIDQTATAEHDGRTYQLRVSRIVPQVVEGRFQVELTFVGDQPPNVRRGQTLDVELTLGATRPAMVLPHGPFMAATGGSWVFVVDKGGRRAERRAIRIGRRNPQFVEVLDGLEPGERVITSSYDGFSEDARLILR
jgi:HlyD family secretion protein